ncbi:Tn3 family transposase [Enterobacter cloacae]|uniref:Tn3 family transposase n=1 Tax=Enterobacter cloacae TaxID=550 RepID=UPI0038902838
MNFALLDLFGYQFAPRYAQVGKVINDMFDVKEDKEHRIQLCLKKPINTHRIAQHWDTINGLQYHLSNGKQRKATLVKALGVQAQSPAAGSPDGIQSPGESELYCATSMMPV